MTNTDSQKIRLVTQFRTRRMFFVYLLNLMDCHGLGCGCCIDRGRDCWITLSDWRDRRKNWIRAIEHALKQVLLSVDMRSKTVVNDNEF